MANQIKIKSAPDLEVLRKAGKILSSIIKELSCSLKSGVTTKQVDMVAEQLMASYRVLPAFKGYRGFPATVCVSINEEIVHGIPGNKLIQEGDIVSLDCGIVCEGYFSDMAVTVGIGRIRPELQKLIDVTRESLSLGIAQAKAQNRLFDISHAVQSHAEANGFSVVRDFVGHGIGKALHEEPEIPNFGPEHQGPLLKPGMVFAIEPMVNVGTWQTKIAEDGWTVETADGEPSAHFEHTVAITEAGPEILTE